VDRLEDELSKATPDAAAIEVLEEELEQAKDELKRVGEIFVDVETRKAELNEENKINKQEMDRTSAAVKDLQFKLEKAQKTVQELQGTREDHLKQKNAAITKVAKARGFRQPWEEEYARVKQEIADAIAHAKTFCPERVPVPDGQTSESLAGTLQRLEATRKQTEKDLGGSQGELLAQANEAKRLHKDAMQEFEEIRALRNVSHDMCITVDVY
jgi:chromosome segregation ATPase